MPYISARQINKTKKHTKGMLWPDSVRRKVVRTWLQTGSIPVTARICDIPEETIIHWRYKTTWWKDYVKTYREEADAGMAARIEKLLNKSVEELEDRLENGDEVYDQKDGQTRRVKMKARDVNVTLKTLSDRHDVLIDRSNKEVERTEQINDKLSKLADAFSKFAQRNKVSSETLDITDVEVIEEEQLQLEGGGK